MKTLFITIFLAFSLTLSSYADPAAQSADTLKKNLAAAEQNIKLLSNALELYANKHSREYPDRNFFFSPAFYPYISLALGKKSTNPAKYYLCPGSEKLKYEKSQKKLSYVLWCPTPEKYNLKALYFTPEEGFVVKSVTTPPVAAQKTTAPSEKTIQKEEWVEMDDTDKEAIKAVISELYNAYKDRDLEKVMLLEDEAIKRSAAEEEKKGKYTAVEVYYAFKGTANDVFRAEGFAMEPFEPEKIKFRKQGLIYQAYSYQPIISTKKVTVGTMKVRLRIGAIDFEKIDDKFVIVKMQIY